MGFNLLIFFLVFVTKIKISDNLIGSSEIFSIFMANGFNKLLLGRPSEPIFLNLSFPFWEILSEQQPNGRAKYNIY